MLKKVFSYHTLCKFVLSFFLFSLTLSGQLFADTAHTGMRNISPADIVADLGAGWNLGNTLDTEHKDETMWGNPYTTKAMIDQIAAKGFKTLRLPVTWRFHMGDAPDYIVEKAWLDRVEEVANYALANDMYVIINVHHDDPWIIPTYAQAPEVSAKLSKLWTQIAERFKEYGDYVIFETLNEPRHEDSPEEWIGGTAEGRECVNTYHKASLEAIRATGGNNATRKVMISTYAASTLPVVMDALVVPNNDPNIIISLHSYFPYQFCLGNMQQDWGAEWEKQALEAEFDAIYSKWIARGYAVVMGEWGSNNQNNKEARIRHTDAYTKGCEARGIARIWWDNGQPGDTGVFNRAALTWYEPEIVDILINSVQDTRPSRTVTVINGGPSGVYKEGKTISITAAPPQPGYSFKEWTGDIAGVEDVTSVTTSLVVPSQDVIITATYKVDLSNCKLPGELIEAEDYMGMFGVKTEACVEGGLNLGYLDAADWVDYHINVPKGGSFELELRVASESGGGQLEILIDGVNKAYTTINTTGGWQEWVTLTTYEFTLSEGLHALRLSIKAGGYNINWLKLQEKSSQTVPVTGVTLSYSSLSLKEGTTAALSAVVTPAGATDKAVTWSSSDQTVAAVNAGGVISALSEGTAVITVTTKDGGYTATCEVTVTGNGTGPGTLISIPFSYDGAGTYTWFTTVKPAYVNSWCLSNLTINGVDFTNKWSNSLPAAQNGGWTITYTGDFGWSHFEAK